MGTPSARKPVYLRSVYKFILENGIKLSMDGKGRARDNAFIERLWRNVKYEEIYLNPPDDGLDLHLKLVEYFNFYNN